MDKHLSIIIPVYNVEVYLSKCLDSILVDNQFTGQVVCVNDGSTDGSSAILEEYAKRVESGEFRVESFVVINQPNAGLSEARNTGLRAAKGEYVLFIDSDDWINADVLSKLSSQINGEEVIYYNGVKYFEETKSYQAEKKIPVLSHLDGQTFYSTVSMFRRNLPWVCVWGALYKQTFLIDNNLWNEPGIYHEDSYFMPQVWLAAKDVSSVDLNVYVYRIRGGSITAAVRPKNIQDALFVNRNLYRIYESRTGVKPEFYYNLTDLYVGMICDANSANIRLRTYWKGIDYRIMKQGIHDDRTRKIYRLSRMSFRWAYTYCIDSMPKLIRRMVNRLM